MMVWSPSAIVDIVLQQFDLSYYMAATIPAGGLRKGLGVRHQESLRASGVLPLDESEDGPQRGR